MYLYTDHGDFFSTFIAVGHDKHTITIKTSIASQFARFDAIT